jgi:putative DNA primase/helicase
MTFDIREHLEKLSTEKETATEYRCVCPVCQGNNLTVAKDSGAYKCWSGDCPSVDIRNTIAPLIQPKPTRPQSDRTWTYTDQAGNPIIQTRRTDDGEGNRRIWQESLIDGQWQSKSTPATRTAREAAKRAVMPYNYAAVQEAIANGEPIFWVEGESCVDALKSVGLIGTTSIGGSAGYTKYGDYSQVYKGAKVVICPDRDTPGLKYAVAVANDYPDSQWLYAFPDSPLWKQLSKDGGWDVADWIDSLKGEGLSLDKVRDRILSAVEPKRGTKPPKIESESANRFESSIEHGLNLVSVRTTDDGIKEDRVYIGHHLKAIAKVDTLGADRAGIHLEFQDYEGHIRRWTMERGLLAGEGVEPLRELMHRGYQFKRPKKAKLLEYLQSLGTDLTDKYLLSDRTGWVKDAFLLENRTYGDEFLRFRSVEPPNDSAFECRGNLEDWQINVAAHAIGNSRLIFGFGVAFGAPLTEWLELEGGGFNLVGESSKGKTTTCLAAASVFGHPDRLKHSWHATANGLEGIAWSYNHLLLYLDEMGNGDAKTIGTSAYMLANGTGKIRANRNGGAINEKRWKLLFLSSTEVGLTQKLHEAGMPVKAGQEVRIIDIPAIAHPEHGVFEDLGRYQSSKAFAENLESASRQYYGTAFDAYIQKLIDAPPEYKTKLQTRMREFAKELTPTGADSTIGRAANRFAIAYIGACAASHFGILPIDLPEIKGAVQSVFSAWIEARGGTGSHELTQALSRIEHLFVTNLHSDRILNLNAQADTKDKARDLLAYCKNGLTPDETEYLVPRTVFEQELSRGVNSKALIAELQRLGWLKPMDAQGKAAHQRWINGGNKRFYVFTIKMLQKDD